MRRIVIVSFALLSLVGCSPKENAKKTDTAPVPAVEKPADEPQRFPTKDQTGITLVDNHIFGKNLLPGGNVATYKTKKGTEYRLFLAKAKGNDKAAILLLDLKSTLSAPKFIPSFGGYYGMDDGKPTFIFQKGPYLAGIVGLKEADADKIAREFAARIN